MNGVDFCAVDVETANYDRATICQIGVVTVQKGRIVRTWSSLVNPRSDFVFTHIHGIDASMVRTSPTLPELWKELCGSLPHDVMVSHTSFDRWALIRAAERDNLRHMPVTWLDSVQVAKRAWPNRYRRRWNLPLIADDLGIEFTHHDALEDAKACARIVIQASQATGFTIADWAKSP